MCGLFMSQAALPDYWLEKYQFSNDVQTLFMWRRGLFGFKLRGEIKRKKDQVSRLTAQQATADIEHTDLTAQQRGMQRIMERLAKKSDSGSESEADKLDLEFAQLEAKIEVQIGHKVNINSELTKAENDLKLMIAYQVNQIRTADEAQREWTGKEKTYEVDRVRDQIREPREKKNRFAGSDEMSKMDANESSEDLVVAEE
jgi:hypothetical protein